MNPVLDLIKHYNRHFGAEAAEVKINNGDANSKVPSLAICHYKSSDTGLPHDVLITAGMSLAEMAYPKDYEDERWSTELILYVEKASDEDMQWMIWLAELPYFDELVIGHGHSIRFAEALYKNSCLKHFLLLETLIKNDQNLANTLPEPVHPAKLLWVVPLSDREYELKRKGGFGDLMDVFTEKRHPIALQRHRRCYLSDA